MSHNEAELDRLHHAALIAGLPVRTLPGIAKTVQEKTLAKLYRWRYSAHVTEKDVTEFDSSICTRRTSRHAAIILFVLPLCAFNGGLGGGAARLAGYLVRRSVNPAQFRHPHLTVRSGLNTVQGGHHA